MISVFEQLNSDICCLQTVTQTESGLPWDFTILAPLQESDGSVDRQRPIKKAALLPIIYE